MNARVMLRVMCMLCVLLSLFPTCCMCDVSPISILRGMYFPQSVVVDRYNTMYMSDPETDAIWTKHVNETVIRPFITIPDIEFNSPSGLAIGPQDELYVCDTFNNRIIMFAPNGHVLRYYNSTTTPQPNDPLRPVGVAVDSAYHVYVTRDSERVIHLSPTGSFVREYNFSSGTSSPYTFVLGVTVSDDNLYVSTVGYDGSIYGPPRIPVMDVHTGIMSHVLQAPTQVHDFFITHLVVNHNTGVIYGGGYNQDGDTRTEQNTRYVQRWDTQGNGLLPLVILGNSSHAPITGLRLTLALSADASTLYTSATCSLHSCGIVGVSASTGMISTALFSTISSYLFPISRLAVDSNSYLYTDTYNHISKLDPYTGSLILEFERTTNDDLSDTMNGYLAIDEETGDVYTNTWQSMVKWNRTGTFQREINQLYYNLTHPDPYTTTFTRGIAIDTTSSHIYLVGGAYGVVSRTIWQFMGNGTLLESSPLPDQFPTRIRTDHGGNTYIQQGQRQMYVAKYNHTRHLVQVYNRSTEFVVDPMNGDLYFMSNDLNLPCIEQWNASGNIIQYYSAELLFPPLQLTKMDQFKLAYDYNTGRLYLADPTYHRIVVWNTRDTPTTTPPTPTPTTPTPTPTPSSIPTPSNPTSTSAPTVTSAPTIPTSASVTPSSSQSSSTVIGLVVGLLCGVVLSIMGCVWWRRKQSSRRLAINTDSNTARASEQAFLQMQDIG